MKKLAKFKKRIRRTETTNAHLEAWLEQLGRDFNAFQQMTVEGFKGPKGDQGDPGTLEGVAMVEELRQRVTRLETKQDIDHLNALRSVQSARAAITRLAVATDEATQGGVKSFANRDRHAAAQEKAQWIEYPWKLDVGKESGKIERLVMHHHTAEVKPDELIQMIANGEVKRSGRKPVATTADGKLYEPKGLNPIAHAEHARKTLGENVMVEYRQTGEHQAYFVKWEDVPDRVWVGKMWNRDAGWCKVGDEIYVRAGKTSNHAIWKAELDLERFLKNLRIKFYVCFDQEFVDLGESAYSFPTWSDALHDDGHIGHTFNSYAGASTGWFVMNQKVWYLGADGKADVSGEFTGDWPVHKLADRPGRAFTSVPQTKPEANPEMKLVFDRWTPTLKDDELHARKLAEEPAQSRSLDDVEKAAADELNEAQDKVDFFELLAKRMDKRTRVYGRRSIDTEDWRKLVSGVCTTLGRPLPWAFDLLETPEPFDGILERNTPVRK